MAISVSYSSIYYPIESGSYGNEKKLDNVMHYWEFQTCLSYGMLRYDSKDWRYPGDDRFRTSRQQNNRKCRRDIMLENTQV